ADDLEAADVEAKFQELEAEARERLSNESVPEDRMSLQRFIDMRYLGQWRSMSIPIDAPVTSLDRAIALFHDEHGREPNYKRPEAPVEVYRLSLTAVGVTPKAELARHSQNGGRPEPLATRSVKFEESDLEVETLVYLRDDL